VERESISVTNVQSMLSTAIKDFVEGSAGLSAKGPVLGVAVIGADFTQLRGRRSACR
jgi:hypothetical protein